MPRTVVSLSLALACLTGVIAPSFAQQTKKTPRTVILEGHHTRRTTTKPIRRVAVANEQVLQVVFVSQRELLLLGRQSGTTSMIVWYADGAVEETSITVYRDLTLLKTVVATIHSGIKVDIAPDRPVIVLRGVVPDVNFARAAEEAAKQYLSARLGPAQGMVLKAPEGRVVTPDPKKDGVGAAPKVEAPNTGGLAQQGRRTRGSAKVINLITVEQRILRPEDRIRAAFAGMKGTDRIRIRRVTQGQVEDDTRDTFVLEGEVDNQVTLVRVLVLTARALGIQTARRGGRGNALNVRVLADEGGGIGSNNNNNNNNQRGGNRGGGGAGNVGNAGGGGAGGGLGLIQGNLNTNVARAKALQIAGGRVISLLKVADLPQVRVSVQFFEINRTKLRNFQIDVGAAGADFFPGALGGVTQLPTGGSLTPNPAPGTVSRPDVLGVVGLLSGALSNQWQYVDDRYAFEAVLNILETEGIARDLSTPSLTVLSGETATVQVGGSIPFNETFAPTGAGGQLNSVAFQQFGVQLTMRPLVGEDDVIYMDISPSVTLPDLQLTAVVPNAPTTAFSARSLQTNTRVRDGQSLLLGGLVNRTSNQEASYPQWLHRIPLLNLLLTDRSTTYDDQELVIFVTTTIVRDPPGRRTAWSFPGKNGTRDRLKKLRERLGKKKK